MMILRMNFSNSQKRLIKEGAWATLGKIISALGAIVGIRLLTEFVRKETYGKIGLLMGIMTLAINIFAAPLLSAAQRFHSDLTITNNISLLRHTILGILKKTIGFLVCVLLLAGIFIHSVPYYVFIILIALLILQVIRNMEVSMFISARKQKNVAILNT